MIMTSRFLKKHLSHSNLFSPFSYHNHVRPPLLSTSPSLLCRFRHYWVTIPQLSPTLTGGRISLWHKRVGDPVHNHDLLYEIHCNSDLLEEQNRETGPSGIAPPMVMEIESHEEGFVSWIADSAQVPQLKQQQGERNGEEQVQGQAQGGRMRKLTGEIQVGTPVALIVEEQQQVGEYTKKLLANIPSRQDLLSLNAPAFTWQAYLKNVEKKVCS